MITACGHETTDNICDYVNRTTETAYRGMSSSPIGDGMKTALWQLSLALLFKIIITIFTFGIKVSLLSFLRYNLLLDYFGRLSQVCNMYLGLVTPSLISPVKALKFEATQLLDLSSLLDLE